MPTTTRLTNASNTDTANIPVLPAVSAAPSADEQYPSLRAIGRSSTDFISGVNGSRRTWIALDSLVGLSLAINEVRALGSSGFRYMAMDPSTISWASITLTGPRPQNPGCGLARYNTTIGTAKITAGGGGITIASAAAVEERMPVLFANALTECRKLPPLCSNILTTYTAADLQVYSTQTFTAPGGYFFRRWLGGSIIVTVANSTLPTWNLLVWPLNPGTLSADIGASVLLATVANNSTTTFTAAQLIAKGIVRWDQFVLNAANAGPCTVTLTMLAPLDLPPPYDCPGYDVAYLKGGYLT